MIEKLQAELLKIHDNLQDIEISIGEEKFKWYFRYITILEKSRISQMCVKPVTEIANDGTKTVRHEMNEDLMPIHTIIEKALDADGNRIFSHTNPEHFKIVSSLPYGAVAQIAYEMSLDMFGTMKGNDGN